MKRKKTYSIDFRTLLETLWESIKMLNPFIQIYNPVMFVTYVGAIFTTFYIIHEWIHGAYTHFDGQIAFWLWLTVLFANFAHALAESRGKAQASSLRKTQIDATANLEKDGEYEPVSSQDLRKGDIIKCYAGDIIPADGRVIEGIATVDESAITGESAPVIRESGDDRSAVTAGTKILCDTIRVQVVSEPGHSFLDRMIALIEGAKRQKTPNEIALNIVLSALTIIFLVTVLALKFYADYSTTSSESIEPQNSSLKYVTVPILIGLLVCLIPTTISALLSAVGIAGMDRLIRRNVVAKSGRSVEAAGDIDLLMIDKTGTITLGNRMATHFIPAEGFKDRDVAEIAQLASFSDETPEGRSIVVLAKEAFKLRGENFDTQNTVLIPFSSNTRISGVDFLDKNKDIVRSIRKGAVDAIKKHIEKIGGEYPHQLTPLIESISRTGGTPLLVSDNNKIVGIIQLKDIIKGGIKDRFAEMRKMGIRTLMVTGDNPLTAAAIAAESGVDDFLAEVNPEMKLKRLREEQALGHLVAMTGDGTNDAPALAQADVGVAMNTGTQASREAGNMVDLDSNPTKLIEIVQIGKQMLMTRGALTTFSISNDLAKYFAIIPAIFGHLYFSSGYSAGPLSVLNIMNLSSHQSAILSAVIFNALIIVALIPLALKGVKYNPMPASQLLRRNLLIYGLGGVIVPFIGIKLIDMLISKFVLF